MATAVASMSAVEQSVVESCRFCRVPVIVDLMQPCIGCGIIGCFGCVEFATALCWRCVARRSCTVEAIRNEAGQFICELYDQALHATAFMTANQLADEYDVAGEIGILITQGGVTFLDRYDFQTAAKLNIALCMRQRKLAADRQGEGNQCHCKSCHRPRCRNNYLADTFCNLCQALLRQVMQLHVDLHNTQATPGIKSSSIVY